MSDQKDLSTTIIVFTAITLLSCCCPASSFLFPRVTRTSDAVIIDYAGVGYAPLHQGKNYGDITTPKGFMPVSSFNPYAVFNRQQEPMMFNGWPYHSYGRQSLVTPAAVGVLPGKMFAEVQQEQGVEQVLDLSLKQAITTTTTAKPSTATPAIQCGRGPATMPAARSLISQRIVGGVNAKKNAWPFMVQFSAISCTGVLISDSKVLIAAQCVERLPLFLTLYATIMIGMNTNNPLDAQMTRRISNIIINSQFNALSYANDIAIITLDTPVALSKTVAPVCLPPSSTDPDQYADQEAIVLGWGSSALQQGKTTIAFNEDCKNLASISQYVSDKTICLSSTTVFTCPADLGGPVVIQSSTGAWTIVGINSFTPSDCSSSGIKTRVSAFRAWIDQYMK